MTTFEINDPWFEDLYRIEFNANPVKFLDTFKTLLTERNQREKRIVNLLKQYENSEISVGKIAEKLNIDREEVLSLMVKHNIYLVDYDFVQEEKVIEKYFIK